MAKKSSGFGALSWFILIAASLPLVYYLYEGGRFSEGVVSNLVAGTDSPRSMLGAKQTGPVTSSSANVILLPATTA